MAVGGSGAAPATKPQQHSLVCKGWNIQSVGATAARLNPLHHSPIPQASAASPFYLGVKVLWKGRGRDDGELRGCKNWKRRGDVWVSPSPLLLVWEAGWGEYRAVQTRRRLAASKPSMLYSPLRHYAASQPPPQPRPYPSHQPPPPPKLQLQPDICQHTKDTSSVSSTTRNNNWCNWCNQAWKSMCMQIIPSPMPPAVAAIGWFLPLSLGNYQHLTILGWRPVTGIC